MTECSHVPLSGVCANQNAGQQEKQISCTDLQFHRFLLVKLYVLKVINTATCSSTRQGLYKKMRIFHIYCSCYCRGGNLNNRFCNRPFALKVLCINATIGTISFSLWPSSAVYRTSSQFTPATFVKTPE